MSIAPLRMAHGFPGLVAHRTAVEVMGSSYFIRSGCSYVPGVANVTIADEELYAAPMMIPGGTVFDQVGIYASGNTFDAHLGIYRSDPDSGGPGDLMVELAAPTLTAVLSHHNTNISVSVEETALYWLAMLADGGPIVSPAHGGGGIFHPRNAIGAGLSWGYKKAAAGIVLPDPFPSSPVIAGTGPLIYLRVANAPPPLTHLYRHRRPWTFWGLPAEDCCVTIVAKAPGTAPTFAAAADRCYAMPIVLQVETPLEQLYASVVTLDVGVDFWMGIYDGNADGYPRDLLAASGAISMATTGGKTYTTANILRPGLYWLAIQTGAGLDTGAFFARRMDGLCQFSVAAPTSYCDCGLTVASVSAGMPDPFPSGASGAQLLPDVFALALSAGQGLPSWGLSQRLPAVPYHIYHEGWHMGPSMFSSEIEQTKLESLGRLRCVPWVLDRETTFDQLWVDIFGVDSPTPGVATRMGVYEDNGTYKPGRLLVETATVNIAAGPATQRWNLEFTLPPGIYWVGVHFGNAGAVGIGVYQQDAFAYQQGWTGDVSPGFVWAAIVGAPPMPDPFVGTTVDNDAPLVGMRVKHYGAA